MSYTIIPAPSGTSAYPQGIGEQLAGMSGIADKAMKDMIFRKAIGNAQLQAEFKQDESGNWSVAYKQPSAADLKAKAETDLMKKAEPWLTEQMSKQVVGDSATPGAAGSGPRIKNFNAGPFSLDFPDAKTLKEEKIISEAPRLANATNYFQKAIEAGGDPAKLAEMVKPERFMFPEQQKEIRESIKTGVVVKRGLTPKAEKKEPTITPAQALNIISDMYKGPELKKQYPEKYAELEKIALSGMEKPKTTKPSFDVKKAFSTPKNLAFQEGQIIPKGDKSYKVVGFDSDGEPLVELVK